MITPTQPTYIIYKTMISILKPILLNYLTSRQARSLLIEVLEKLAASTDNKLDDIAVDAVRRALLPTE